jgi:hypothetical protein
MPTQFDDVNAICPYFQRSDKRKICCEGVADGCTTNLEFETKAKRNLHRRVFCDAKYKNCEVYRMLEEKYAE